VSVAPFRAWRGSCSVNPAGQNVNSWRKTFAHNTGCSKDFDPA